MYALPSCPFRSVWQMAFVLGMYLLPCYLDFSTSTSTRQDLSRSLIDSIRVTEIAGVLGLLAYEKKSSLSRFLLPIPLGV